MDLDNEENKNVKTTFNYYRFFGETLPASDKIDRWMAFNKEPIEDLQYKDRIYLPVLRIETKLLFQYSTQGKKAQKFRERLVKIDWTSNKTFISSMKEGIGFLAAKRNEYEQNRKGKGRQRVDEDLTDDEQDEMKEEEEDEEEKEDEEEEFEEPISSEETLDDSEEGDEVKNAEDDTKHQSRESKRRNSKEEREDSDDDDDDDLVDEETDDDSTEEESDDDDDDDLKQRERGRGRGKGRTRGRGKDKGRTRGKGKDKGRTRGRGRANERGRGSEMRKGRRRSFSFFLESAEPEYNPGRLAAPKTKKKSTFNPTTIDASTEVETEVSKYIYMLIMYRFFVCHYYPSTIFNLYRWLELQNMRHSSHYNSIKDKNQH